MKNLIRPINHFTKNLLLLAAWTLAVSSCNTIWDDDDCGTIYRVNFKYDYNMVFADAFASQVNSVTLYTFDADGKLVCQQTEKGEPLKSKGFYMPLDVVPGNYRLIAWAGTSDNDKIIVPQLTEGVSTIDELNCRINRYEHQLLGEKIDSVGYIKPFWHGQYELNMTPATRNSWNYDYITIPLVKNTNTIRIILQQMSGKELKKDDFIFSITDNNGWMNYDNSLNTNDGMITYLPYYKNSGSAGFGSESSDEQLNMVVGEMSIGRLIKNHKMALTVKRAADGKVIFSIPLIKFMEICRLTANYNMDLQEYLDREDQYVMTFFLDDNMDWIKTQIIINDWIVRFNDITPEF